MEFTRKFYAKKIEIKFTLPLLKTHGLLDCENSPWYGTSPSFLAVLYFASSPEQLHPSTIAYLNHACIISKESLLPGNDAWIADKVKSFDYTRFKGSLKSCGKMACSTLLALNQVHDLNDSVMHLVKSQWKSGL